MSLRDNVRKLWRDSPDFSQRFTGMFGDDGKTITGRSEKSSDGSNWVHDFDFTYGVDWPLEELLNRLPSVRECRR